MKVHLTSVCARRRYAGTIEDATRSRPIEEHVNVLCLRRPRAARWLLWACAVTLTATVAGCGGSKPSREQVITSYGQELREAVSTKVADEPRRARMLAILEQLDAVNRRFTQETRDFVESYRELNADYGATRPAFDRLFSDYSARRIKARSEALDLHFQLASLATAAEWDAIGKAESKLYEELSAGRSVQETK
jgi:uncharacterized protein YozE (UPF0346 family)